MEECRRRGFTEFVAFKFPDGRFNVRGPSGGVGYDRMVHGAAETETLLERLNSGLRTIVERSGCDPRNVVVTEGADVIVIRLADAGEGAEVAKEQRWLIWSFAWRAWWGPNSRGYYADLVDAGRYSKADAEMRIEGGRCHRGYMQGKEDEGPADVLVLAPESGGGFKRPRQMGWPKAGEGISNFKSQISKPENPLRRQEAAPPPPGAGEEFLQGGGA